MNVKEFDNKSLINLEKRCLIKPIHELRSEESIEDDDYIEDEMDELMDEDWVNGPK